MSILSSTWPVQTQSPRVPWGWVFMMSLPVGMSAFVEKCSGTAMTFTLKKFISDPSAIMLLGSVNIAFGVLIAPWVAWRSDNMWTPIGRRKPFMLTGLLILAACLMAMPLVKTLWVLIPVIILYQFSMDLGYTGPWSPLYLDTVPDAQRGRGMVINRYVSFAARLVFMYFLIGKFDEHVGMRKLTLGLAGVSSFNLTGEQLIYFTAAGLVLMTLLFLWLGVRENKPQCTVVQAVRPKPSLRLFMADLFGTAQRRLLCLPVIAGVLMTAKLSSLRPLLLTEQFGYSKQVLGNIHSVSMLVNAALVLPLMAIIIDRRCRLKIFITCIVVSTVQPILFWCYVKFMALGQVPSPHIIVGFHIVDAAFDHAGLMALWPMVFQKTGQDNRGRTSAAFLVATGIVGFLSKNLLGLWVKGSSALFCPSNTYDYMSGYLYIFAVGIVACVLTFIFARKRRQYGL